MSDSVFLGVVSVPERTEYLAQVMAGIREHFESLRDLVCAVALVIDTDHKGPGWAKNELLGRALETDASHIFLSEDDVVVQSPEAITGYIRASKESCWEHLAFHAHGPANAEGPIGEDPSGCVEYFPHYVGAWCLYSRRSIETCGLMDEHFKGSWDHVEHTLRLSLAGFHPMPEGNYRLRAADAVGSEKWLAEIPGSIENTALPHTDEWRANRDVGRAYWKSAHPESFYLVFSR